MLTQNCPTPNHVTMPCVKLNDHSYSLNTHGIIHEHNYFVPASLTQTKSTSCSRQQASTCIQQHVTISGHGQHNYLDSVTEHNYCKAATHAQTTSNSGSIEQASTCIQQHVTNSCHGQHNYIDSATEHNYCKAATHAQTASNLGSIEQASTSIQQHVTNSCHGQHDYINSATEHNYCKPASHAQTAANQCSRQQPNTCYHEMNLQQQQTSTEISVEHYNSPSNHTQTYRETVRNHTNNPKQIQINMEHTNATTQAHSCSSIRQESFFSIQSDQRDHINSSFTQNVPETNSQHQKHAGIEDNINVQVEASTLNHQVTISSAGREMQQSINELGASLYNLSRHNGPHTFEHIDDTLYTNWNVPGDGNCFFHCISLSLHGDFSHSEYYRKLICAHIIENWEEWGDLAVLSHSLPSNDPIQYWDIMANNNEWATVSELKVACEILQINIVTWLKGHRLDENNTTKLHYTKEMHTSPMNTEKTLHLLLSNSHYTVLTKDKPSLESSSFQNRYDNQNLRQKRKAKTNSLNTNCTSKKQKRPQISNIQQNVTMDHDFAEMPTYQICRKLGIQFEAAKTTEDLRMKQLRRNRNKAHIKRTEQKLNVHADELPNAPPLSGDPTYNNVMDTIRAFELQQMSYNIGHCSVCHERRIEMEMAGKSICQRCNRDKKDIKMFSSANNMDPQPMPSELQDLTIIEQQLISRLAPVINIHMLKHGGIAANGHCVTFTQNVNEPAQILPQLPKDIKIIRVRRKGANDTSKDFNVRRSIVEKALNWLKKNNEAYQDIIISQDRLNDLPEDATIDIETLETGTDIKPSENDNGPAPKQVDPGNVDSCTASCAVLPDKSVNIREEVEQIVRNIVGPNHDDVTSTRKYVTIPWPTCDNEPLSEFTTKYFFTLSFPCLFPYGHGDFHINRPRTCASMSEWAEHLMWYEDGRFAQHPYFKFIVHNIIMRKRTLEQSSYVFKQHLGEEQMSIADLKEKIQGGDTTVAEKILYFGACLRGTNQYWAQRGKELRALIQYQINEGNGLPAFFCTGSCAEYHFKPLRRLLSIYTKATTGQDLDLSNRNTLFATLQKNTHIVSHYFDLRTQSYFKNVMKSGFGVDAYWYRQEFAKSRGMVHWHGLCWRGDHEPHNLLHEALQKGLSSNDTAETLSDWAKQSFGMTATHPAGTDTEGNPRKDLWPPPEGTAPQPEEESNPLLKLLMDVSDTQDSLLLDHLLLSNRINIHRCSDYCLRSKNGKNTCRMEFGTDKNPGKEIRDTPTIQRDKNGSLRLEMERDHPMLVQHSQYHTQGWRANGDISLILSQSPPDNPSVNDIIATERYITGYACKGNQPTGAMVELFNDMANSADETTDNTTKPLITKLLMNTVKRDISSIEASYELTSLPLYRSSHTFQSVSFSGSRVLEKSGKTLTRSTPLDKYLARHPDDTSSWYQFICQRGNVPVINGRAIRAEWPPSEEYCRSILLLHTPNWRQISDIKDENCTWNDTFQVFLNSQNCPNFIKADIERARRHEPTEYDLPSQSDVDASSDTDEPEWLQMLKPNLEFVDPKHDIASYDDGGPEYNWSNTIRDYPIGHGLKWVDSLNESLSSNNDMPALDQVSPYSLNNEQKLAFNIVMQTLIQFKEKPSSVQPLRLIVSGTAGSGKSFLIKCLVNEIQSVFNNSKSVQVLCPTGNSANLIGGKTIHSFLKIPTGPAFNKEMSPPDGERCKKLQENFENLVALIVDERSLVGSKTLGWMEFLCQHGSQVSQPWGGLPVVVFLGDDIQLPPVCDTPVYVGSQKTPSAMHGFLVWKQFKHAVELKTVVRQNMEQSDLKSVLSSLRQYDATSEQSKWLQQFQWENLKSRYGQSSMEEMAEHALHVFPTHAAESQHNHTELRKANLKHPVAQMKAINKGPHAKSATSDQASGLSTTVFLCRGAKVMLTSNLSVSFGLFNGSMGVVTDIIYLEGRSPKDSLPDVVMVNFSKYTGKPFLEDDPKVVPIVPVERVVDCFCHGCRRKQIPLRLGWGTTIHKCQGMTIGKGEANRYIVIDPGTTTFESRNPGALFVALSRAKSAGGLLELPDFAWNPKILINQDRVCHRVDTPTTRARAKEMIKINKLAENTKQQYETLCHSDAFDKIMRRLRNCNLQEE